MTDRHRLQQALLDSLRGAGDPALARRADELEQRYQHREMALLADDVYEVAKGAGTPPAGWVRGSENLALLRAAMPGLPADDKELLEYLKPRESGFRAEIYLPDPAVLGNGHKPTLVFKGSSGQVLQPDGTLRDTTAEDFLANNFPQSVGLRTDYYDRAMGAARELKAAGVEFDIAGHSLGAGMGSAASAVTGMQAVTFNAAGLHHATAPDFARRHGLALYDTNQTVVSYQVRGELLNDGVQDNLRGLGAIRQAQLAAVLRETSTLLQDLPQGKALLTNTLTRTLPEHAHPAAIEFVNHLASRSTAQLVRELPAAAGQQQPLLAAMTERDGVPVERLRTQSLQELSTLAGPVMNALHAASAGARAGRLGGEGVAAAGRAAERALDGTGDVVAGVTRHAGDQSARAALAAGELAGGAVRQAGQAAARGREMVGEAGARIDGLQGQAQRQAAELGAGVLRRIGARLPGDHLDALADRLVEAGRQAEQANQQQAEVARRAGRETAEAIRTQATAAGDTIVQHATAAGERARGLVSGAGQFADAALDGSGRAVSDITARAPVAGAAIGGGATGSAVLGVQHLPTMPMGVINTLRTTSLAAQARPAGTEAFERHLMTDTVIPSLNHDIAEQERAAREALRAREARSEAPASIHDGAGASVRPGSEAGQFLDRYLDALQRGDPAGMSRAVADYARTDDVQTWMAQGREDYAVQQQAQQRQAEEAELAQRQQASQGFARAM